MSLNKTTARNLAINYAGFLDAVREKNADDIKYYGGFLDIAQEETGIILMRKTLIEETVKAYAGSKGPQA